MIERWGGFNSENTRPSLFVKRGQLFNDIGYEGSVLLGTTHVRDQLIAVSSAPRLIAHIENYIFEMVKEN